MVYQGLFLHHTPTIRVDALKEEEERGNYSAN